MSRIPLFIVGPSNYFKGGLTTYTLNLLEIFRHSSSFFPSVLFLNKFIPKRLFPGKNRNPADHPLIIPPATPFYNGLDWFLFPSIIKCFKFLFSFKSSPNRIFLIQWWTSSVLHIYLTLAYLFKFFFPRSRIILEIHEVFDPLEQRIKPLGWYVSLLLPKLLNKSDILLFHSHNEVIDFSRRFSLQPHKIRIAKHILPILQSSSTVPLPTNDINILYFGLIRDYKGVPLLIQSFNLFMDSLNDSLRERVFLHIVGEIWDEKDLIFKSLSSSPYHSKIHLTAKYIPDNDIPSFFNQSAFLVLPYLRGTQSGVLHIGMNFHLPIITTDVGGFRETLATYEPKIIIPPNDLQSLVQALHTMILNFKSLPKSTPLTSEKSLVTINDNFIRIVLSVSK